MGGGREEGIKGGADARWRQAGGDTEREEPERSHVTS